MSESLRFLDRVWGRRHSYVDLPSKVNGHWIPWICEWPDDRDLVARRIESCLEDGEDLYFSVAQFRSKGRRLADTLPSRWLWADLDKVDPVFLGEDKLQPTISWESSPGRFQCLWRLDRALLPETLGKLNRALSYAIGADKGGWDLTQVLRPPGTRNHKYSPTAEVELLWDSTKVYTPKAVVSAVRRIQQQSPGGQQGVKISPAREAPKSRSPKQTKLPARAKRLLKTPPEMVVVGERSARLWELERLLADAGLDEEEIFSLVWPCSWNKHREVHSGERRLRAEIEKALARVDRGRKTTTTTRPRKSRKAVDGAAPDDSATGEAPEQASRRTSSPFIDYATFLGTNIEQPRWLIEDIWSSSSHGIIGGEPKTSKSTVALAMALSVATGKPFLGQFPVLSGGPALMIQEENAPWVVQDRLRKIAHMYGLIKPGDIEVLDAPKGSLGGHIVRLAFPSEAPLRLLNNYGFSLLEEDHRAMLEEEVQRSGTRLLIVDPLYLVAPGVNFNYSHEVMPVMQWLMALRYNYDMAVIVVHHWSKPSEVSALRRPGQRLMGSGLLHGWIESALYFEALEGIGDILNVRVEREFRNVAPRSPLELSLRLGEPGDLDMAVDVRRFDLSGELLGLVAAAGETGISLPALAEALGVDKRTARSRAVGAGCRMEQVKRGRGHGWQVYPVGVDA